MGVLPIDIEWLGHAGFRINTDLTIYIDPYKIKDPKPADLILITHNHYDHCSPEDVKRISNPETIILCTESCCDKLSGKLVKIKPGQEIDIKEIKIEAVSAYNINKEFHKEDQSGVGYILTIKDLRIYHAGDTDKIPEMESIKADIVMVPVGGTYTMDATEAAEAVNMIKPKYAIPMHYGTIVGSRSDADEFEENCECEVIRFD